MSITIGANVSSLRAQRARNSSAETLSSIYQRLSSGQRINQASDDAAALSIGESLRTDTKIFAQAIRNVNDGISVLNIASGALTELAAVSMRQRELATQAATGTYSIQQRRSMNREVDALTQEFNRIVESSSFNGIDLLDSPLNDLRIQTGYGADASIASDMGGGGAGTHRWGKGLSIPRSPLPLRD